MKKTIKLTEKDLTRIVKRVIEEQTAVGTAANTAEIMYNAVKTLLMVLPQAALGAILWNALSGNSKGVVDGITQYKAKLGDQYQTLVNAITKGDLSKFAQILTDTAKKGIKNVTSQAQSGMGNK